MTAANGGGGENKKNIKQRVTVKRMEGVLRLKHLIKGANG